MDCDKVLGSALEEGRPRAPGAPLREEDACECSSSLAHPANTSAGEQCSTAPWVVQSLSHHSFCLDQGTLVTQQATAVGRHLVTSQPSGCKSRPGLGKQGWGKQLGRELSSFVGVQENPAELSPFGS